MTAPTPLQILCVDDSHEIFEFYRSAIEKSGFMPVVFSSPVEATAYFKANFREIALVISDYQMPEMTGFEFRQATFPEGLNVPLLIVSGFITRDMALTALDLKVSAFLEKPVELPKLLDVIRKEATPRAEAINEAKALEKIFIEEARGIIDDVEPILLSLDQDRSNTESINAVYRGAHTLKGSSGVLDTELITRFIHKYEDIISALKNGGLAFTDAIYDILLRGFDRIKELIEAVPAKETGKYKLNDLLAELSFDTKANKDTQPGDRHRSAQPNAETKAETSPKARGKDSLSVPISMLDDLSAHSGEITVLRNMITRLIRSIERQDPGNKEIQNLTEMLEEMHKINSTVHTRISDLRKVPLGDILKPLPRIVRDLGKNLGKNIKLLIEGDTLRVDNALATVCSNSLVHLVRNSIDHGIELPEYRRQQNKPEQGFVAIRCVESRDEVTIIVEDDGKGIDPKIVRKKAIEKGLYNAQQIDAMTESEVLGIIFAPGFSTAAAITDVSGRGVGTDMVKSSVEAIGGIIEIQSRPGSGTTFRLRLPIPKSVLIISSLMVRSEGQTFAIPQENIARVLTIPRANINNQISDLAGGKIFRNEGSVYPLIDLKDVLSHGTSNRDLAFSKCDEEWLDILLLKYGKNTYAMRVDDIHDWEENVVKTMPKWTNTLGIFSGSTFLADGSIGLILDVPGIAELSGIHTLDRRQSSSEEHPISDQSSAPNPVSFLLFDLGSPTIYAAPISQVYRLEEIPADKIQKSGTTRVVIYRDSLMPMRPVAKELALSHSPETAPKIRRETLATIVTKSRNGFIGLEVDNVIDVTESNEEVSRDLRSHKGIAGNLCINERVVTVLDLTELVDGIVAA